MEQELNVLGMYDGGRDGCSFYRVLAPFKQLNDFGFSYEWEGLLTRSELENPKAKQIAKTAWPTTLKTEGRKYPVLHLLRMMLFETDKTNSTIGLAGLINQAHSSGAIIGTDFDDDLFNIAEHNPAKVDYTPALLEEYRQLLPKMDYLTCSTDYLAGQLAKTVGFPADRIWVVPNLVDMTLYDSENWIRSVPPNWLDKTTLSSGLKKNEFGGISMRDFRRRRLTAENSGPLVIGLQGGATHYHDWQIVAPALAKIVERFGDKIRFLIAGFHPDYLQEILAPAVKRGLVWWKGWTDFEHHATTVMNIDINLCPLEENLFNRSKSPIKWLEASAAGAASVVSPTVYGEFVANGQNGLIAQTSEDWEAAINALIENPALRRRIARTAHSTVRIEYNLQTAAYEWVRVHQEAWQAVKG